MKTKEKKLPGWRKIALELGGYYDKQYKYLRTSNGATARCGFMARNIITVRNDFKLRKYNKPTIARLVILKGLRKRFPFRNRYWKENPERLDHCVVKIGAVILDVTRRQLDPFCPHPFVSNDGADAQGMEDRQDIQVAPHAAKAAHKEG